MTKSKIDEGLPRRGQRNLMNQRDDKWKDLVGWVKGDGRNSINRWAKKRLGSLKKKESSISRCNVVDNSGTVASEGESVGLRRCKDVVKRENNSTVVGDTTHSGRGFKKNRRQEVKNTTPITSKKKGKKMTPMSDWGLSDVKRRKYCGWVGEERWGD